MAIVRLDPARDLASMEIDRLNRMFANFFDDQLGRTWTPAVDIYETDGHEVVLKAELPEVKREDISITSRAMCTHISQLNEWFVHTGVPSLRKVLTKQLLMLWWPSSTHPQ